MNPRAASLPEYLKAEELAALLRVSRKTIYEAVARGEIPGALRVGRLIRFRRDAVLEWLADTG
ncbi:helix-turn-helix domain-containing protein [Plesiocystis pacifica]|uniref:helix-turn-helix domain-containing protein n=1 Tax=Plesiocystis pacifica TaxID=191768 RepID=UPI0002F4E23A|nr:helix-turn-helix domain-containing protein [Plesiocystis pacifica]